MLDKKRFPIHDTSFIELQIYVVALGQLGELEEHLLGQYASFCRFDWRDILLGVRGQKWQKHVPLVIGVISLDLDRCTRPDNYPYIVTCYGWSEDMNEMRFLENSPGFSG